MGKTADSPGSGAQPDPVQSFNRWKKKYSHRQKKKKQLRKQLKKPKWQVGCEGISRLMQNYEKINVNEITRFSYRLVTEIQKQTTGLALQGKDVLGAAKTGSGKTLAFLVPVQEALYRLQWTSTDGLGVLIISPMRELAYQNFEVLQKVGKNHGFSAGLIIGAKDLKHEAERINNINILVCTPGRLLQHMDETVSFHATDLQMLVLDEVDRTLEWPLLILKISPRNVRLYFSQQHKLNLMSGFIKTAAKNELLYSFLRSHLKKSIVFFSSCKEVQYLYRVFCQLCPGISILQQMRKMEVYNEFVRNRAVVLFASDIAAKGPDFPGVNWTPQFDCPEDANTYIHRAGRTAGYKEDGETLLILLASEKKKIGIFFSSRSQFKRNSSKLSIPEYALSLGLAVAPCIRFLQKVQKQHIKELVMSQADEVIESMAPSLTDDKVEEFRVFSNEKMSILLKGGKRLKGAEHRLANNTSDEEQEEEEDDEEEMEEKLAKAKGSQAPSLPNTSEAQKIKEVPMQFLDRDEEEEDADFLKVKWHNVFGFDLKEEKTLQKKEPSKSSIKKKSDQSCRSKKSNEENFKVSKKITGTDEGELVQQWPQMQKSAIKDAEEDDDTGGINLDKAKARLQEEDKFDKEEYRKKIKAKHQEERLKEREANKRQAKAKDEEEAFLDWNDDDDGFDPSTLPDPDKYRSSEDSDSEDMENEISDTKKKQGMKKRKNSEVEDMGPTSRNRKKAKWDTSEPLDTGLSSAEDEELVLHLLRSQS
uniref:ATP-dependent RNA helicase n=1 Tax=Macaca nemestrina TaxID=9545 RepID=A0A2K6D9H5_MACNE